jgi:diguanylate cyclase (GGDEF)-like protein
VDRHTRELALGFGCLGVTLTLVYALSPDPAVASACMGLIAVASMLCLFVGPRLNRSSRPRPWQLIGAAATVFLVGVVMRPWAQAQQGAAALSADLATLAGYALLLAGLLLLIRSRGRLERHAIADGVIVCLGVWVIAAVVLAVPASQIDGRPTLVSLLAAAYPVIDVVLLLLLLNLAFTTAARQASYQAMTFAMLTLFVGDLGYAWIGAQGQLTGSRLLDLPYILTYTFFGVAALHPSIAQLSATEALPIQAWSVVRLSLIVPALAMPAGLLLARSGWSAAERALVAVGALGQVSALLVRAVTAVRDYARVQGRLWRQARHDPLTDLANRVQLTERVDHMLRHPTRGQAAMWLVYFDLDAFKLVNDSWGHETGDALLREVAARLTAMVDDDMVVARIGGDEFALAGRMTTAQVHAFAHRLQATLAEPIVVAGLDLVVTASIGMAHTDSQGSAEGLLRDADTAMYRAKADGRDRVVMFDPGMRQTVRDRVELELALRHAMARDQLWIAYQPIVDLAGGETVGAEALLRWSHPIRGDITPAEFIPVAEETGLIVGIGEWVLRESTRQLAEWDREGLVGPSFFVSVNASPRQLRDGAFHAVVHDVVAQSGVIASRLVVEITESVMLEHSESVMNGLTRLRDIGVMLSVDDFGTGYSSLGYLSKYPVTGVKVDRSFVDGLGDDAGDEAIVCAVAAMASALNLSVIAEGVETAQQREVLHRIGIGRAQGWLWGRAVDAATFADMLAPRQAQAVAGNS